MRNEFFRNIILSYLTITEFDVKPKLGINSNKITIYNGLQLPQSKSNINSIVTFVNETIIQRFIDNENLLRNEYENNDLDVNETYQGQLDQFKSNILIEFNNIEYFRVIYNQNDQQIKKLLLKDYLNILLLRY